MDGERRGALVADGDEYFRLALRTILTGKLGFAEIAEAASLDEALEHLSQDRDISLALFHLPMPGIGSPAHLAAVRGRFPQVRAAVVSKSLRKQDILMALEAGVHGYVPQAADPAQLTRAIEMIVDGVVYVPPSVTTDPRNGTGHPTETSLAPALTQRQREVLELVVEGRSNKEIAAVLDLREGTAKVHVAALFRIFGVNSRAALAAAGAPLVPKR